MSDRLHLGLDIGSISLNTVILDDEQNILFEEYTRLKGQPYDAALNVLERVGQEFDLEKNRHRGGHRHRRQAYGRSVRRGICQ